MGDVLDRPPDEPEGDDQNAKEGSEDTEVVTQVDFQTTEELDETDHEDDD